MQLFLTRVQSFFYSSRSFISDVSLSTSDTNNTEADGFCKAANEVNPPLPSLFQPIVFLGHPIWCKLQRTLLVMKSPIQMMKRRIFEDKHGLPKTVKGIRKETKKIV